MADMSDHDSATPSVTVPFALVGLVGGGLVATVYYPDGEAILRSIAVLVVIFTPIVAGCFGAWLTPRLSRDAFAAYAAVVFGTLVAGALNGFFAGLPVLPFNFIFGPLVGVVCALAFLPPLILAASAARRAGAARVGSLSHAVRRRAIYLVAAASAAFGGAFGASMVMRSDNRWPMPFALFCLAGAALSVPFLLLDVLSLVRARGIEKAFLSARPLTAEEAQKAVENHADVVDLGLGAQTVGHVTSAPTAYRDGVHVTRMMVGSRRALVRTLLFAIGCDLAVLVGGATLGSTGVASRLVNPASEWPTSNDLDSTIR